MYFSFFAVLSRAQRALAASLDKFHFECIGSNKTDDEIVIAQSLRQFSQLINAIEDERDRMVIFFRILFVICCCNIELCCSGFREIDNIHVDSCGMFVVVLF